MQMENSTLWKLKCQEYPLLNYKQPSSFWMEMEPGKLFIGGISWDTNEERLRDYFQTFGEVIEAVIMKDRTTGRARGFGFIVFLDPAVAERVVQLKHIIDGRAVEAKKAVPRDDQQSLNRSNGSVQGSPGPTRTKKIFVGGLASTVTESDFKNYFDQFGTTTDVVVMYDHNTQRPRGFGFITYDSEESVDKVLLRTFHELNGKMVEVKRAVPKESSPGSNRSNISGGYNGLSRVGSYFNGYSHQGYNPSSLGGYGIRVDGRFSPGSVSRTGYSPFGPSSYNMGPNSDSVLGTNYGGNGNSGSSLGYGRVVNPMYSVTPNRYTSLIGGDGNASVLNSTTMWGNGNQSYSNNSPNSGNFLSQGNDYGSFGAIWANPSSGEGVNGGSNFNGGNGVNAIGYGRNNGNSIAAYGAADDGVGGSFYADSTWRSSSSPDVEVPGLFNYGFGGGGGSQGIQKKAVGYVGYSVANRSNRGIAA
ncbi:hypothetical protein L6452_19490 [Arctium lappa]|uniref:Uncharacterized protein n=1 Tax=Arctium lappa TaxID=4217 RepID=A0ACB9B8Q4_ARCLA|nr:hypothetical protein L6452_19490 [Arctium lappa]